MSGIATRTVVGRCLLALLLITPFIGPSVALYHTKPGSKAEHLMLLLFWPGVGLTFLFFIVAIVAGIFLGAAITPATTIKIDHGFVTKNDFTNTKFSWRRVAKLAEEPDYFCFTGWSLFFYIPKLAFDSRAEADAFYRTALVYWREAKGLPEPPTPPVPDATSVWPPAPRPGNSVEPDDGREC